VVHRVLRRGRAPGHRLLTSALVHAVNPEVTLEELAADVTETGYPGVVQVRRR